MTDTQYINALQIEKSHLLHWANMEQHQLKNLWYRFWAKWFWIDKSKCLPQYRQLVKVKGLPNTSWIDFGLDNWVTMEYFDLVTKWKAM